jgi:hypothetical protein
MLWFLCHTKEKPWNIPKYISKNLLWNVSFDILYVNTGPHLHSEVYLGLSADFYDSEWLTQSMYLFVTDIFCVHSFPLKLIKSFRNAEMLES